MNSNINIREVEERSNDINTPSLLATYCVIHIDTSMHHGRHYV